MSLFQPWQSTLVSKQNTNYEDALMLRIDYQWTRDCAIDADWINPVDAKHCLFIGLGNELKKYNHEIHKHFYVTVNIHLYSVLIKSVTKDRHNKLHNATTLYIQYCNTMSQICCQLFLRVDLK